MNDTVITVLGQIVTALIGAWAIVKIREVHTIVNSQRTEMVAKIEILEEVIRSLDPKPKEKKV